MLRHHNGMLKNAQTEVQMQLRTSKFNSLISKFNSLISKFNSLISKFNSLISQSTERTSKSGTWNAKFKH